MDNDTIHIACALDDNFLMPVGVMLVSLFENNKSNKFHIHLFSSNLNNENIEILKKITVKNNAQFQFLQVDKSLFEKFKTNNRIPFATYYRILIPKIIDSSITKLLYLDGDMIINGNIKTLWETDLNGYVIAAVNDVAAFDMKDYERLNIPEEYGYFNSGVILIDVEKWNSNEMTQRLIKFLNENMEFCRFHDQDGLNAILFKDCKRISPYWNQQAAIFYCDKDLVQSVYLHENIKLVKTNPAVIHFNGREKPWHYVSSHPFTKIFKYYFRLSGLKNISEKITLKKIIKKEIYRYLGWSVWSKYIHNKYKKLLYASDN